MPHPGGLPATAVATAVATAHPDKIARLVSLAAYRPADGDTLFSLHGLDLPGDVSGVVDVPADPVAMFYADVAPAVAATAVTHLRPQSMSSWTEPVHLAGPLTTATVTTTYLLCEQDQAMPPELQKVFAARCDTTVCLAGGHSPFLADPAAFAERLTEVLTGP